MRITHKLNRLLKLENADFIAGLYREFARREPASRELDYYVGMLSGGVSKERIVSRWLQNQDVIRMIEQANGLSGKNAPTTIGGMGGERRSADSREYVRSVYRELLLREPDEAGLNIFLSALDRGVSRMRVFMEVLGSGECRTLLHSDDFEIPYASSSLETKDEPLKQAIVARLQMAIGLR